MKSVNFRQTVFQIVDFQNTKTLQNLPPTLYTCDLLASTATCRDQNHLPARTLRRHFFDLFCFFFDCCLPPPGSFFTLLVCVVVVPVRGRKLRPSTRLSGQL